MTEMATVLASAPSITLGVDGPTNVLSRSMSNVIAHDPRPWFVGYLRADMKKETAVEVFKKIADTITRMHAFLYKELVVSFVSDSCNLMRAVRDLLVFEKVVGFAYGCGAHPSTIFAQIL